MRAHHPPRRSQHAPTDAGISHKLPAIAPASRARRPSVDHRGGPRRHPGALLTTGRSPSSRRTCVPVSTHGGRQGVLRCEKRVRCVELHQLPSALTLDNRRIRINCGLLVVSRRSRVRVPSLTLQKAPLTPGFQFRRAISSFRRGLNMASIYVPTARYRPPGTHQSAAARAHNPKVEGSNRAPAIGKTRWKRRPLLVL